MFKGKDVKRAFRDFRHAIQDFLSADWSLYQSRAEVMMSIIQGNPTLSFVINPYLNLPLDISQIETPTTNYWMQLKLPTDQDQRIAYILQTINKYAAGTLDPINHTHLFFKHKHLNDNVHQFNQQVVSPALRDLLNKLTDLEEDEIIGNEEAEISPAVLNIINYGHITAGRNLAFGQHIQQNIQHQGITEELIVKFLQNGIPLEKVDQSRPLLQELDIELKKDKPDHSIIKSAFSKLVDIGGNLMANIAASTITNKEAAATVTEFLKNLM